LSGNASGDPTRNSPDIEYLFLATMNISFKSQQLLLFAYCGELSFAYEEN